LRVASSRTNLGNRARPRGTGFAGDEPERQLCDKTTPQRGGSDCCLRPLRQWCVLKISGGQNIEMAKCSFPWSAWPIGGRVPSSAADPPGWRRTLECNTSRQTRATHVITLYCCDPMQKRAGDGCMHRKSGTPRPGPCLPAASGRWRSCVSSVDSGVLCGGQQMRTVAVTMSLQRPWTTY
jgi:hypothetical protein